MRNPTRLLSVMVISAALPLCVQAAEPKQAPEMKHVPDLKWNGFLDLTFMLSDGTVDSPATSPSESKFDMNGELDLNTTLGNRVTARMDFDLGKVDNSPMANGDSGQFEQAYVNWESPNGLRLRGGIMNNPLGWEAEDAPDLYQISHGQLYSLWDNIPVFDPTPAPGSWSLMSGQNGNNVVGILVSGKAGVATLTGAFLNDLSQVDEQNSFMGVINFKPDNRLDLEIGFVTQDAGLETIMDFNGTYTDGLFMVGAEVMLASEFVDMGFGVTGVYKFSEQVSGTLRVDNVSYDIDGVDDSRSVTVAVGYMLEKNLMANAEVRINNTDDASGIIADGDQVQLELVATF